MPARDGTGPLGQGPRTGRGMGNCNSTRVSTNQSSISGNSQSFRVWDTTFGRLFGRRRAYHTNRKQISNS